MLSIISAFYTVSENVAFVLARIAVLDLLAIERKDTYLLWTSFTEREQAKKLCKKAARETLLINGTLTQQEGGKSS